jgi:hypothetical protein
VRSGAYPVTLPEEVKSELYIRMSPSGVLPNANLCRRFLASHILDPFMPAFGRMRFLEEMPVRYMAYQCIVPWNLFDRRVGCADNWVGLISELRSGMRWLVIILLSSFVFACGESPKAVEEHQKKEREALRQQEHERRVQILNELKTAHNADDTWNEGVVTWTADIQERLIRKDGRPIAGFAKLRDVEKWNDGYQVFLYSAESTHVGAGLQLVLKCNKPDNPSQQMPGGLFLSRFPEYAFVARVHTVKRHEVTDMAVSGGEEGRGEPSLDFRIRFIAEGECLGLRVVEKKLEESEPNVPPKRKRSKIWGRDY